MSLGGRTVSWLEILPAVTQTHRLKTGGTVVSTPPTPLLALIL